MEVDDYTDEEGMEDVNLDKKRECHWRMVFKDNDGGVDDVKVLLNANRGYVYINEKEELGKVGYLVEVVGHENKRVIW